MKEVNQNQNKPRRSKTALTIVLLLIAAGVAGAYFAYINYCASPIQFSIGEVDSNFKISESDVELVAEDAAGNWNKTLGKDEFKYSTNAKLKINLIYDQRQADLDKLNADVNSLNQTNQNITNNNQKLSSLITEYETDLSKYNSTVNYWNSRGGAPTDTFNGLEAQRKILNSRRDSINKMAELLNIQAGKYNLSVEQIKDQNEQNKNKLITQGMYFSRENKIDIYTFGDKEELRLVLMHELGHSHGLKHATESTSVMYPILGEQDLSNPVLTAEDKQMILKSGPARIINNFIWHTVTSS